MVATHLFARRSNRGPVVASSLGLVRARAVCITAGLSGPEKADSPIGPPGVNVRKSSKNRDLTTAQPACGEVRRGGSAPPTVPRIDGMLEDVGTGCGADRLPGVDRNHLSNPHEIAPQPSALATAEAAEFYPCQNPVHLIPSRLHLPPPHARLNRLRSLAGSKLLTPI